MTSIITSRLTVALLVVACLLYVVSTVSPVSAAPVATTNSPSIEANIHATETNPPVVGVQPFDDSYNDDVELHNEYNNNIESNDDVDSYYEEIDRANAEASEPSHHEVQKRGYGCWKGSSGDCNRHCIVNLHKRGGMCSGWLGQRCTCY
jgi:hypothetical protein